MRPESGLLQIGNELRNGNDVTIFRHHIIVNFFDIVLFLLSILVVGSRFMSIYHWFWSYDNFLL